MNSRFNRLANSHGVTLVELILMIPVIVFIGIWASGIFGSPAPLVRYSTAQQLQDASLRTSDTIVADINQASSQSINWNALPPINPVAISSFSFQIPNYVNDSPTTATNVVYYFQPSNGTNQLVRVAGSTTTIVGTQLDAPTAAYPFVQQDTNSVTSNMLVITLLYTPPGGAQVRMVRRAGLQI